MSLSPKSLYNGMSDLSKAIGSYDLILWIHSKADLTFQNRFS